MTESGDRYVLVSEIVADAIEAAAADRDRIVRDRCAGDAELEAEVRSLIAEAETADDLLDHVPRPDLADLIEAGEASDPLIGRRIGGYTVTSRIADGGMGRVYEAEQEIPKRRVALKVMRMGLQTRDALSRFRAETEILGRLRHDHIAQIYSAGTFDLDGTPTPFFAMELIENARTITEHAAAAELALTDRVRLFISVCHAVELGHRKGVIHRDLKPANILVADNGAPKVIDYGVARVSEPDNNAHHPIAAAATEPGRLIGTMAYMSPEQSAGRTDDLDTRSDVYALGVVLYEMLTGRLPYHFGAGGVGQIARTIESNEPTRPSSINKSLRGDLEAILLKALEKDPARRYGSAAQLADDLERWLDNRPVSARPISLGYQLRKLAARHQPLAAAILIATAALTLGAAISAIAAVEAAASAREATEQAQRVRDLNRYLSSVLSLVTPEESRSDDVTVREMLTRAIERIDTDLAGEPLLAAQARHTIGDAMLSVGVPDEAEVILRDALNVRQRELGESPETLQTLLRLGEALLDLSRLDEAQDVLANAVAIADRLGIAETSQDAIEALNGLGIAVAQSGDLIRGEQLILKSIERAETADIDPLLRIGMRDTLGVLRLRQGRTDEAVEIHRETSNTRRSELGPDHPDTLTSLNNLGRALQQAGDLDGALAISEEVFQARERVLGPAHPRTLSAMNNHAIALSRAGEIEQAEPLYRATATLRRETLGNDHPETIASLMNLAGFLTRNDNPDEGDAIIREVWSTVDLTFPAEHPTRRFVASQFIQMSLRTGNPTAAETAARETLAALRGRLDPDHWEVWRFTAMAGIAQIDSGERDAGLATLQQGYDGLERVLGPDASWTRWTRAQLDHVLDTEPPAPEPEPEPKPDPS
ncbi:MAG: tetratricopeptide repeat protein [Planctomycetota bacterium]